MLILKALHTLAALNEPHPEGSAVLYRVQKLSAVAIVCVIAVRLSAQTYTVAPVTNGGTIKGTVTWSGPLPQGLELPINKDPNVCDPEHRKFANTDRLIVAPDGGVANTVVFLKNIDHGKAMNLPEVRRSLDQRHCRYEPHILIVPLGEALVMKSSDPVLHTVHMTGAATFNVPFPFSDRVIAKDMTNAGSVSLRCNGGHIWMNAEMMVVPHPYYAVTDQNGTFELTDVPAGNYELVAWHEGWHIVGREAAIDVFSQAPIQRAVFSEPKTWEKAVTVHPEAQTEVEFVIPK